jgi:hypothetical protein
LAAKRALRYGETRGLAKQHLNFNTTYRARALSEPHHKSSHEHHAYYYKDEVMVTTTKAIIAIFLV